MIVPYIIIVLSGLSFIILITISVLGIKNKFVALGGPGLLSFSSGTPQISLIQLNAGKSAQQQSRYGIAGSVIGLLFLSVIVSQYFLINLVFNIILTIIVVVAGIFLGRSIYCKNYKKYKDTIISSD